LEIAADLPERATIRVELATMIGKAILELHSQCAAKRIEPEDRVGAEQIHPVDRDVRDQVPVHGIAERVVEAGAVHIDGEPLRDALQG
jgi:hypothetical protein